MMGVAIPVQPISSQSVLNKAAKAIALNDNTGEKLLENKDSMSRTASMVAGKIRIALRYHCGANFQQVN